MICYISDKILTLLPTLMVKHSQGRESLTQHPRETQLSFTACSTTCELIINVLRAQNSQVSRKKTVLCVLFLTDNNLSVLLLFVTM